MAAENMFACECGKEYKYRKAYETHRITCLASRLSESPAPQITRDDFLRLELKLDRALDAFVPAMNEYYTEKRKELESMTEIRKQRANNAEKKLQLRENYLAMKEERRKEQEELTKQPKQKKRRQYGGYKAPDVDIQDFTVAGFATAFKDVALEYAEMGFVFKKQSAETIIAACVNHICGGVPFIKIRQSYQKDKYRNPLFFDLNEKGRWFNRVPRDVVFKRLTQAGRFIPPWSTVCSGNSKAGWEYFRSYLHRTTPRDSPLLQSGLWGKKPS